VLIPFGRKFCYTLKSLQMGLVPVFYLWVAIMDVVKLVETTVGGLGYELVDVERSGRGLLRVFIDKPEGIAVEDCQVVSNQLTRLFTVENVNYDRLEVSSPGLDRALKKEADFIRFMGQKAQVKLRMPIAARKSFTGIIGALDAGVLHMDVDGVQVEIELANVDKARLVPTF
jgi:ribosome maturation factor RimP